MTTLHAVVDAALPALLLLAVPGALALLALAGTQMHKFRLARDAAAKSLKDKFLASVLDLADDAFADSTSGVSADLKALENRGNITGADLKAVALAEWARVKKFFGTSSILTRLAKTLNITVDGVEQLAVNAIAAKLGFTKGTVAIVPGTSLSTANAHPPQATAK